MTKILTLLLTSTSLLPIVPVVIDNTVDATSSKEVNKENPQDKSGSFKKQINEEKQKAASQEKENLKKLIAQNRRRVNSLTKYQYDNKEFYSKDTLNEYMLKNNRVGQKVTSSNPNKIIKDTENMILDNSKIYDVDLDNATQVYRDAFGNIAYTREDALATYATDNSVKVKYSYTGQDDDWHDSPTEAETQVKYGIKINKSLYYQFNGKFYNAFNKEDNTALLNTFAPAYYTTSNQRPADFLSDHEYETFAREGEFNDKYANEIKEDFRKNHYDDVVDLEQNYAVTIKNSRSDKDYYIVDILAKNYDDLKEKFSWDSLPDEYKKEEITVGFQTYNNIQSSEAVKSYFDYAKHSHDFINRRWGGTNWGKRGYYYKNYTGKDGNQHKLFWVHSSWKAYGSDDDWYLPQDYTVEDKTTTTLKVYLDEEAKRNKDESKLVYSKELPKPTYDINDLNPDTKVKITDSWYDYYYNKIATNFTTTRLECENVSSQACDSDYTSKKLTFDDLQNDRFISNGIVYKDRVYNVNNDIGYSYSVIKSWYDFKLVKQKLLNDPSKQMKQSDGSIKYELRPDLFVTKEELDNYLPLSGNVNARVMYSFIEGNPHLSSQDGTLLANTTVEAKNKSFLLQNHTLRKKNVANDVFNHIETSFNSGQQAIEKLRHNELLTSKFVNNKEIEDWANQISDSYDKSRWKDYKRSWDSIISDGRYTVYYIWNKESEQEIYFPSLELAIKALGKEVKETKIVESEQLNIYVYDYIDQNGNIVAINFENDNFNKVIDTIQRLKN